MYKANARVYRVRMFTRVDRLPLRVCMSLLILFIIRALAARAIYMKASGESTLIDERERIHAMILLSVYHCQFVCLCYLDLNVLWRGALLQSQVIGEYKIHFLCYQIDYNKWIVNFFSQISSIKFAIFVSIVN